MKGLHRLQDFLFPTQLDWSDEGMIKLQWLIRLRWIAVFSQALSVVLALRLGFLDQGYFYPFECVILLLVAFNLLSKAFANYCRKRGISPAERVLFLQLLVDLVGMTILLLFSGGAWNPLAPLLFLHVCLGALLLKGPQRTAFFVSFFLSLLAVTMIPGGLPPAIQLGPTPRPILLVSYSLVATVTWALVSWLSATLRSLRLRVTGFREQRLRSDRLRAIGALAAGFSHEFATPLNTMRVRLERLSRDLADDPRSAEGLADTLGALEQCERALKGFASNYLNEASLELMPTSLGALVKEAVDSWSSLHPRVKVSPQVSTEDRKIWVPRLALTRSILDLLDNAAQSKPKGAEVRISVTEPNRETYHITIEDNGPGFPELVFRQLGEPFVTTKPTGAGLGIYNAHTLTQALGGDLLLSNNSALGGAKAVLVLPIPANYEKESEKELSKNDNPRTPDPGFSSLQSHGAWL
jgi:two-component system sensor histidine kinase RegB